MKHIVPIFLLLPVCLWAQDISPDSMLAYIWQQQSQEVLDKLGKDPKHNHEIRNATEGSYALVHALASFDVKDTALYAHLQHTLLSTRLNENEARALIRFIFSCGVRFVTRPELFAIVQDFGFRLAKQYKEPRAQFSFLQQQFTMHQMAGRLDSIPRLLRRMDTLCMNQPYLDYRRHLNYGMYHAFRKQDSCIHFFEVALKLAPQWVGKPNPYFLNEPAYAAKMDSSVLAVSIMEYARHHIREGDLKKAGELLVQSVRLIPDTSTFAVINVQNHITLAMVYADLVNSSRALSYIQDAVALCELHQLNRMRNTQVAAAFGYILMADGQYEAALPELESAFSHIPRQLNCQEFKRQALRLALNSTWLTQYQKAQQWLDTSLRITCEPDAEILFLTSMLKGQLALHQKRHSIADQHFTMAFAEANRVNAVSRRKLALYHRYLNAKEAGQLAAGISNLEAYTKLNDSLYRTGQEVALLDIQAAYQKSLQEETIARLDAENEFTTSRLAAQKRNTFLVLGGLLIASLLSIQLWRLYQQVKKSNVIISRSIAEKNILLREIHHRVKNNLQVISSLLKLQSGFIKDDAAVQAIAEGRSRVQSMALLHQNLYKEDNLTGVNMNEYFNNLIQGLFDTYNISSDRIQLHKQISPLTLDVDTVVPLGLITNELISNALKHAFPNGTGGNLYIDLYEEHSSLILKVRDDGTGLTAPSSSKGFGSKLIQSLSQKLEADITTRTNRGTEVILTIRDYKKAA